jgi:hypothetical protein
MEVALRLRPVIRPRGFGLSMASTRSRRRHSIARAGPSSNYSNPRTRGHLRISILARRPRIRFMFDSLVAAAVTPSNTDHLLPLLAAGRPRRARRRACRLRPCGFIAGAARRCSSVAARVQTAPTASWERRSSPRSPVSAPRHPSPWLRLWMVLRLSPLLMRCLRRRPRLIQMSH